MSEVKTRGPATRCYINAAGVIECHTNLVTTSFDVSAMAPDVQMKAARSGVIWAHQHGATVEDILSGAAFSDRVPPKGKQAPAAKGDREPTFRERAIAAVRLAEIGPRHILASEALAWARSLTPEQKARALKSAAVKLEYDKARGKHVGLDAMLAAPVVTEDAAPTDESMDDAAD